LQLRKHIWAIVKLRVDINRTCHALTIQCIRCWDGL